MKKFIAVLLTAAAVAPLAVPAMASASTGSIQSWVARSWGHQLRNSESLIGARVTHSSVRCRYQGGGQYSCLGKSTIRYHGIVTHWGIYITATNHSWHTRGSAFQL